MLHPSVRSPAERAADGHASVSHRVHAELVRHRGGHRAGDDGAMVAVFRTVASLWETQAYIRRVGRSCGASVTMVGDVPVLYAADAAGADCFAKIVHRYGTTTGLWSGDEATCGAAPDPRLPEEEERCGDPSPRQQPAGTV